MQSNVYKITESDMCVSNLSKFPYNKVLQWKWGTEVYIVKGLCCPIKDIIKLYRAEKISLLEGIQEIYKYRDAVKTEKPIYFNKKGWYDMKVFRELPGNEELLKAHEERLAKARENVLSEKLKREIELAREVLQRFERRERFHAFIADKPSIELSELKEYARKDGLTRVSLDVLNYAYGIKLVKVTGGYKVK